MRRGRCRPAALPVCRVTFTLECHAVALGVPLCFDDARRALCLRVSRRVERLSAGERLGEAEHACVVSMGAFCAQTHRVDVCPRSGACSAASWRPRHTGRRRRPRGRRCACASHAGWSAAHGRLPETLLPPAAPYRACRRPEPWGNKTSAQPAYGRVEVCAICVGCCLCCSPITPSTAQAAWSAPGAVTTHV